MCCRFSSSFTFNDAFYTGFIGYLFLFFTIVKSYNDFRDLQVELALTPTLSGQFDICQHFAKDAGLSWIGSWFISLLISTVFNNIYWTRCRSRSKRR